MHYFYDWDSLAACIDVEKSSFKVLGSFEKYHMIIKPLIFITNFLTGDSLLSFKLIIMVSNISVFLLTIFFIHKLTNNLNYAILGACGMFSFGYVFLSLRYEDNILNHLFNLFFLLFFFNSLGIIKIFEKYKHFVTGLFLGISVSVHLNSILLYIYVFFSLFLLQKNFKNFLTIISKIILGSLIIIGPIMLINAFYYNWNSFSDFTGYFTSKYHESENWFFAREERNILNQLKLVNYGITSLFFQRYQFLLYSFPFFLSITPFLNLLIISIFGLNVFYLRNKKIVLLLVLFLLTYSVNSLFLGSQTSERWLFLMTPIVLILSYSLKYSKGFLKKYSIIVLCSLPIIGFMGLYFLTNFSPNQNFLIVDNSERFIVDDSVIVLPFREDSEFGLYASYVLGSDNIIFSYNNPDLLNNINEINKTMYITNMDNINLFKTVYVNKLTKDVSLFRIK